MPVLVVRSDLRLQTKPVVMRMNPVDNNAINECCDFVEVTCLSYLFLKKVFYFNLSYSVALLMVEMPVALESTKRV